MRANMWTRILVAFSFFSLTAQATPPDTQEPGTRVNVRLAEASGQLPDTEQMVESIKAMGGEHQILVKRHHADGQQALTLDLWGNTVPHAEIPTTLREAFPVLASADIQVSTIDPKDRPKFDKACDLDRLPHGEKGTVKKKVVKIIKKE